MIKISPFTPLFFEKSKDRFGVPSKYMQIFAPTDCLFVEVIATNNEPAPTLSLNNIDKGTSDIRAMRTYNMNSTTKIYYYNLLMNLGLYTVTIGDKESEPFVVTDDDFELARTTLIQYAFKDNRKRTDIVSEIDDEVTFFAWRAPGGFKDNGWFFDVDNEQFTTSDYNVIEIYSHDSTNKTFTLGNTHGCPVWYAAFLNKILCCDYVFFDGVRYGRYDASVPEQEETIEGINTFVFSQQLREIANDNADYPRHNLLGDYNNDYNNDFNNKEQ